jgi:hypothetical protein
VKNNVTQKRYKSSFNLWVSHDVKMIDKKSLLLHGWRGVGTPSFPINTLIFKTYSFNRLDIRRFRALPTLVLRVLANRVVGPFLKKKKKIEETVLQDPKKNKRVGCPSIRSKL